ncbi:MAG: hypothetical protein ABGW74_07020 [Campylobacterales bacterium]
MKIINRLYIKVIIIAFLMLGLVFEFYYFNKKNTIVEKPKKEKSTHIQKVKILQKELNSYKQKLKYLNEHPKVKIKIKKVKQIDKKYKKMMMYNIHHQILQELKYAPYLPAKQLQTMMEKRFVLDGLSFKIFLKPTKKVFDGIKITKDKTESIVRTGLLLEVKFVDKK